MLIVALIVYSFVFARLWYRLGKGWDSSRGFVRHFIMAKSNYEGGDLEKDISMVLLKAVLFDFIVDTINLAVLSPMSCLIWKIVEEWCLHFMWGIDRDEFKDNGRFGRWGIKYSPAPLILVWCLK
jgi:hypothetical protein